MKTKLGKKIERLAGMYPRMQCPHCGYKKLERVSRYCNICGEWLENVLVPMEPDSYGMLPEMPDEKELVLHGDTLFDIETEEYEGFRRIMVIRMNGVLYMHHSFNGELLECIDLQETKGISGGMDWNGRKAE